jgi:UDP-glucose 4-epimerase
VHLAETNDRGLAQVNGVAYEAQALRTLTALRGKGFSKIVYASSAAVYGDQSKASRRVEDPVFAVDTYTRIKLASEKLVLEWGGVVARLVNLYGPGMSEGNVLNSILEQLGTEGPICVRDASPVRDFLWIDDAVAALAAMATREGSGVFNAGSGVGYSILDLANLVVRAAREDGRSIKSTKTANRISRLVVDITETEKAFGWRPSVTLFEGVATLVKICTSKG